MEKETMRQVLTRAKGSRSFTQYAKDCGISRANMYRIAKGDIRECLSERLIDSLADNAQNNVTREEIVEAGLYALRLNYRYQVRSENEVRKMLDKMSKTTAALRAMSDSIAKAIAECEEEIDSLKEELDEFEDWNDIL